LIIVTILSAIDNKYNLLTADKIPITSNIFNSIALCPSLAIWVRRLHDAGYNNRWILKFIVYPFIFTILFLVIAVVFLYINYPPYSFIENSHLEMKVVGFESQQVKILLGLLLIAGVFNIALIYGVIVSSFVAIFKRSVKGSNEYGPNPLNENCAQNATSFIT
jgi:uncharacterized membrane protein YhaH (DUF805 family)